MATSRIIIAAIATAATAFIADPAHASFFGDQVNFTYYFGNVGDVFLDHGNQLVPGAVFDLTAGGEALSGTNTVTVNADQIVVELGDSAEWTAASFNGWVLTDLTKDPGIASVVIASQSNFALNASMISFTSNSITVNWQGLFYEPDSSVTLDVSFAAPVPIPAALPLFASGLAGLGWLSRRRRRAAVEAT